MLTATHQNGRLACWTLQLQSYDFAIHYCSGSKNANADALFHLVEPDTPISDDSLQHSVGDMLYHALHSTTWATPYTHYKTV